MQENQSEVARLRQRIADEYLAAQRGLTGLAYGTAKHKFITKKMEAIHQCHAQLKQLVGEQQATQIMVETVEAVEE